MTEKIIRCAKCQQNAETNPRIYRSEYTITYPIRDKDGKIYCWDCYKGFSSCKGCGESVANIKFPRSGQPQYPHCNGGVSYNCERISNNVEFICSKKCSQDIANRKYQAWKDKLSQGWTKCEKCIKKVNRLIKWFNEDGIKNGEWLKGEKHQSRFIKLVPPGQGKLCLEKWGCKWGKEAGKPRLKEVRVQAQKYWETLPYEDRIKEVIRSRNAKQVAWGGKFKNWTAEQIAAQNEVPSGIRQEFELKDCHRDCQNCHLEQDFKNSSNSNNLFGSMSESSLRKERISIEIENKKNQLLKLKEEGGNPTEIAELEQEIKELLAEQNEINFSSEKSLKNNGVVPLIIGVSFLALLGIIAINSFKVKKNRNRYKS